MSNTSSDLKLEVVVIPVSSVDRARDFYVDLGFRLDADFALPNGFRVVQLTPPGSATSIIFGDQVSDAEPGSARGLHLVSQDIEKTREELAANGADVSAVWHDADGVFHHDDGANRVDGPAADRADYGSFLSFSDPDGNAWTVQEIVNRLPGREDGALTNIVKAADRLDSRSIIESALRNTADAHGVHERDDLGGVRDDEWPVWYAEHLDRSLREAGYRLVAVNAG